MQKFISQSLKPPLSQRWKQLLPHQTMGASPAGELGPSPEAQAAGGVVCTRAAPSAGTQHTQAALAASIRRLSKTTFSNTDPGQEPDLSPAGQHGPGSLQEAHLETMGGVLQAPLKPVFAEHTH